MQIATLICTRMTHICIDRHRNSLRSVCSTCACSSCRCESLQHSYAHAHVSSAKYRAEFEVRGTSVNTQEGSPTGWPGAASSPSVPRARRMTSRNLRLYLAATGDARGSPLHMSPSGSQGCIGCGCCFVQRFDRRTAAALQLIGITTVTSAWLAAAPLTIHHWLDHRCFTYASSTANC